MITMNKITDPGTRVVHSVYGPGKVIRQVGTFKIQVFLDQPVGACGLFKITAMASELKVACVQPGCPCDQR